MAARKRSAVTPGSMPQRWREKIRTSMLINRLEAIVEGKTEAEGHQVTAALGLLKKTLPDLTENKTEHSGSVTVVRRSFTRNPNP